MNERIKNLQRQIESYQQQGSKEDWPHHARQVGDILGVICDALEEITSDGSRENQGE